MPTLGAEVPAVQLPMLRYAQDIGWKLVPQAEALLRRGGESGRVFTPTLTDTIIKLNQDSGLNGTHAADVLRRLQSLSARIEGNRDMLALLRGEWSIYHAGQKRQINVHIIDFDNLDNNLFEVTPEWEFTNGKEKNRYDLVFLLNGIPILVAETKAAHKANGVNEGIRQIRRYHEETPEMMTALQMFDVTQLRDLFYGVTWNLERKNLFNWRDEQEGNYEAKIKAFCDRRRILKYVEDYIVFAVQDDELHKYILRQHQTRAVEKIVDRARDPQKRRGLIWHTQGSGKTLTMITAAQQILEHPAFEKPTVLMLVDRNELETQLFNNIRAVGVTPIVTESKQHVQALLANDYRGLIVSMIHKFEGIPKDLNTRPNIFVLIDEAHRSTGGHLGNYLLAALPQATWIGFTGTPVDRTAYGSGTFKIFGGDDHPRGYLDKYSIRESVADGTTLKRHYQLAPNKMRVDRDLLDSEFMTVADAQGIADIDKLNAILDRAVNLKAFMKDPDRVDALAQFVAQHFWETIEPMGYKAFLVGVDRQACALYKKALDKYLPPSYSQVVYTSAHNDTADLKAHRLDPTEEKRIRKAFVNAKELPKILIVTEKLLTGYDAPVLYCMYLDKPMRDHVLLQAIARVNRPYEESDGRKKPAGFVLDFVGIFENLEKALAFDSEEVEAVIQNIDVLKALFKTLMQEQATPYLKLSKGGDDKAVEVAIAAFTDKEKRAEFYRFFKKLEALYEIISPDVFLRDFMDDYLRLARLYEQVRSWFTPQAYVDHDLMNKTRFLVQKNLAATKPTGPLQLYEIDEKTLEALQRGKAPDSVKIINLAKSLAVKVAEEIQGKPHLKSIGDRAQQIVERYNERQIDTQTALQALEDLVREYNDAKHQEAARHFEGKNTFAVFWLLHRLGVQDDQLAIKVDQLITEHPHWKINPENARRLRLKLTVELMQTFAKEKVAAVIDQLLALERQKA
jgi:type I restriction enzyme R subunit